METRNIIDRYTKNELSASEAINLLKEHDLLNKAIMDALVQQQSLDDAYQSFVPTCKPRPRFNT